MIKINFVKSIDILSNKFEITYPKDTDGGFFCCGSGVMRIGVKSYKKDPKYTLMIISHEVMEIILLLMGGRFSSSRTENNYLFNFDHQTFENAIQMHTDIMAKFIK